MVFSPRPEFNGNGKDWMNCVACLLNVLVDKNNKETYGSLNYVADIKVIMNNRSVFLV